jgi:excisionase family DNA binding protein
MADYRVVTVNEACAIVGVTRRTMYTWINSGKLKYVRTPSGRIRIYRESLLVAADGSVEQSLRSVQS